MSTAKQLPLPREQLIIRDEIRALTGCSQNQICYTTKYRPNKFPNPVHRGANRLLYYNKAEILIWLSANELKGIVPKSTFKKDHQAIEKQAFDNALALMFISRPTVSDVGVIVGSANAKTTVVHLQERNDYTPPHSGLALFRTGDSHRVAHDGGGWL